MNIWRVRQLEEKTAFTFLAVYRGFSLVVATALIFSVGNTQLLSWPNWIPITAVGAYTLFKISCPFYRYRKNALTYTDFGIDLVLALSLPMLTGGLHSPFLLYSLSPLLTSALLFPRKLTFSIAILPAVSVITGQILVSGTLDMAIFYPGELSFGLLGVYLVGSVLLAGLPYVMNINASRDMKARAVFVERKRLSRDMHDGVAQALGIIRWRMDQLGRKIVAGNTSQALNGAMEIRKMVEGVQQDTKEIIEQLRTTVSDSQGFVPSLAQYTTEFTQNYGIKCELHMADGEVNISEMAELELLCVAQEALTNVRKHAEASIVKVSFKSKDDGVELTIGDNGRGFDLEAVPHGYGMTVMAERARSIGGELIVNTNPGGGTEVKVKLTGSKRAWPGIK